MDGVGETAGVQGWMHVGGERRRWAKRHNSARGVGMCNRVAVGEGGLDSTRVGKRQGWDSEMAG